MLMYLEIKHLASMVNGLIGKQRHGWDRENDVCREESMGLQRVKPWRLGIPQLPSEVCLLHKGRVYARRASNHPNRCLGLTGVHRSDVCGSRPADGIVPSHSPYHVFLSQLLTSIARY